MSWLTAAGAGRPAARNRRPAGLSPAEHELWAAFPTGDLVDLTGRGDRIVRASVLAQLLLGGCEVQAGFVPAVRLRGAHIIGRLDVSGGRVECELRLERCLLAEAPKFANAHTRQLRFADCELPGFDGGGLQCDGYLSLSGSTITGTLSLTRAQLLGGFRLNNTKISNPDPGSWAVFTGGLVVEAGAFIRNAEITGGLRLTGARMNAGIFMEGTTLSNPGGVALDAQNIIVADAMECSAGFSAEGKVRLRGARINGTLSFSRAVLNGAGGTALHASHMQVDELILWTAGRIEGPVSLSYSRIGLIQDGADSWPDKLWLNGLTYDSLRGGSPKERLDWVNRDEEFHLQPYEQLADWYRRNGHDDLARKAQLAKMRARRRVLRPAGRIPGLILDWTVGYGYRPWRAALWFGLLLTVGTIVFSLVHPHSIKQPGEKPHFNAFAYTLDLLVPVSMFGQRDAWDPAGWTQWLAYALIVTGWMLATALIAGVTRVLRPN
ncbi:hypothetical protein ACRYCC_08085 [Actinomadura scrupuli]|uniref:hypothetical protein n=1 Tax=Actinomadura scrupuli TaxID=559629 RepID=UPI003D961948